MHNVTPGQRPQNDAGYLEMMTKVIFMGGGYRGDGQRNRPAL